MKKRRKNPHAVALGKLGGLVRSAAKQRASRDNGRKGGRSKAARRELLLGETPGARGRGGASRKGERGDHFDPGPFRIPGYWLGLWRNPLFRPRTRLNPS